MNIRNEADNKEEHEAMQKIKRKRLIQHLEQHGCYLKRAGSNHDIYTNGAGKISVPVPRHIEIKPGTVHAICIQLGVPPLH